MTRDQVQILHVVRLLHRRLNSNLHDSELTLVLWKSMHVALTLNQQ